MGLLHRSITLIERTLTNPIIRIKREGIKDNSISTTSIRDDHLGKGHGWIGEVTGVVLVSIIHAQSVRCAASEVQSVTSTTV